MKTVVAIGFFDGLHCGHRKILNALLRRARAVSARPVIITFRNHPTEVFAPDRSPRLIMTSRQRIEALRGFVDDKCCEVRALEFTREMAAQTAEEFAVWLRSEYGEIDTVFCGENWTFGAGGKGNADFLRSRGFRVDVVKYAVHQGLPISSTRVRRALKDGKIPLAAKMLGHSVSLQGKVFGGKGLGEKLGFPTINVAGEFPEIPFGVYAVRTPFGGAVANYGFAPTMGSRSWKQPVFEVHIIDYKPSPRPKLFEFELAGFIRPERKFSSFAELKKQIAKDVLKASRILARGHLTPHAGNGRLVAQSRCGRI